MHWHVDHIRYLHPWWRSEEKKSVTGMKIKILYERNYHQLCYLPQKVCKL